MSDEEKKGKKEITRRQFLTFAGGGLMLAGINVNVLGLLESNTSNPLEQYPNRDWEKIFRNIYQEDSHFHFLCAPNDTHNCLLKAFVKNGVVTRIGPSYQYGEATDLYGNKASHRWDPRICQKGVGLVRRLYGDRRVKSAMIRKGFKDWVDKGFPRDKETGKPPVEYMKRGEDKWLKVSWDEVYDITAKTLRNVAETYSGEQGTKYLHKQGYDPAVVEATHGAGVQTLKFRGGMALLGATRIFGYYRFANMLALLDAKVRNVKPEDALGARGWDSYSWHTDLPPGHPMVTGAQTNEFELFAVERAKLLLIWGLNWITTKMPDAHWMTEARLKGAKVVVITVEYPATACRADEVIVIRPGTDPALALSLAQVIIKEKLYDVNNIKKNTDLPFLVRLDTLKLLHPEDVIPGYKRKNATRKTNVMGKDVKPPLIKEQGDQYITEGLFNEWQDFVVWDAKKNAPAAISRDDYGDQMPADPVLEGLFDVTTVDGKKIQVRPVFDLMKEYVNENYTPEQAETVTWAPKEAIISLARQIANNKEQTLFTTGMGTNQYFNNDLKDRSIFFLCALTRNLGYPGGNVGSYAGNFRGALIGGLGLYVIENPFDLELDATKKPRIKKLLKYESAHFFNDGDRTLRVGGHLFAGKGHINTPSKVMMINNSNSLIGNAKGHYDVVFNTLKGFEMITVADYWWTASCEYADIVYGCDAPAEFKKYDFTASCTNPFAQVYPRTPLPRIFDTKPDVDILAGVAIALGKQLNDKRFAEHWKFVTEDKMEVYSQRIINASANLAGYTIQKLEEDAKNGRPALMNCRTYPRISSYEQVHDGTPYYTKSGRLEFYRHEDEWIEHGENMIVYREPIDATFYEPNVIVGKKHTAIRPKKPEDWGFSSNDLSTDTRQVRNIQKSVEELMQTKHPLMKQGYKFILHTPKYRHGAHTTPSDTDLVAVWFGPFADMYRRDKRIPFVTEMYVDINPLDAKEIGVNDGDYVHIDADPEDRPYRGAKKTDEHYKVARLLCRARYYPGTPRGVTRMWHNVYPATIGSVKGHETRPDGLAKNPETNYQSLFRYGSHQSTTRAWLRPTLLTDSLVHKEMFGQTIGKGFEPDIHCADGAPREGFVTIQKAEDGGIDAKGPWRPVKSGIRPTMESETMLAFINGKFIATKK
ncbi:molybdopterin-dependent oxidoreductase [Candidatus Magnetominusculus dajiuhuensis]|uniref:molybdopterin-dependent oxidoreductase n=1 Tax=Candidatus Magnetominusculus dajiuhuensis TaxID=3137712 RepID=UPI003B439648